MDRVLILHRVAAFETWKEVFDGASGIRSAAGEREYEVLRSHDDPDLVMHLSTWTSVGAARAFFESAELVAIRERAGVESPEFVYLTSVESGSLSAG